MEAKHDKQEETVTRRGLTIFLTYDEAVEINESLKKIGPTECPHNFHHMIDAALKNKPIEKKYPASNKGLK